MSQITSKGFKLYGTGEIDKAKSGLEYCQSINGNTSDSAFRILNDWMVLQDALLGNFTLNTNNKTVTGGINELNTKLTTLDANAVKTVKQNGETLDKINGEVNVIVPTKTSDIENDSHIVISKQDDISDSTYISFGDTINIVTNVNRDINGHVLNIETKNSTFPVVSSSDSDTGLGNAVTSISVNNGVIKGLKGETFATKEYATHTNIEQLNKIGETEEGEPTYNGVVIGGGSGTVESVTVNGEIHEPTDGNITLPNYSSLYMVDNGLDLNGVLTDRRINTGNTQVINSNGGDIYVGNPSTSLILESNNNPKLNMGDNIYNLYHTGNKPTASDVGAIPTSAPCNKNWVWEGKEGQPTYVWGGGDGINMYVYNPLNFKVLDSQTVKSRDLCSEIDSLKSTVVNGKQTVANAINDKCGTSLSSSTSYSDMAYYISGISTMPSFSSSVSVSGNNPNLTISTGASSNGGRAFFVGNDTSWSITVSSASPILVFRNYYSNSKKRIESSTIQANKSSTESKLGSGVNDEFFFLSASNITVTNSGYYSVGLYKIS